MMKLTLTALALFGLSKAQEDSYVNDEDMKLLWGQWKDTHSKSYEEAEDAQRLSIFAENYNKIIAHNANPDNTFTMALNDFADLTGDEWRSHYAGGHVHHHNHTTIEAEEPEKPQVDDKRFLGSTPSSWDWRQHGAVGPVKNQKQCKGCWAFAGAAGLEALHKIKTGSLLSFSEQQLLDCDKQSHGCNAGSMVSGLSYAAQYGIELESNYPFVDKAQSCRYSSSKATKVNNGYKNVAKNNANALMAAIVNQPVLVAIEANQAAFQFYKSGVITSGCGASTDHAVLAIGYATVNGHQAILVKNSYGTNWGESGYAYISTSSANGGKGVCGILEYPAYPY